jgi:uncharacterized membrane protein YhaH (DUF805 family)
MIFDAFISHSSKDKTIADATCAALEAAGIRCWIAPRDVVPGHSYGEDLIDALDACRVMVLVFSSNSNASPQISREVERCVSRGITVVPLRIEDVLPTKAMAYFVGSVHWLDALTPPLEQHLEKLVSAVKACLPIGPAVESVREPPIAQTTGVSPEPQPTPEAARPAPRAPENPIAAKITPEKAAISLAPAAAIDTSPETAPRFDVRNRDAGPNPLPTFAQFYFSPSGRISRSQYWLRWILPAGVPFVGLYSLRIVGLATNSDELTKLSTVILTLVFFVLQWSGFVIMVKRIHDRDKTGKFAALFYGPWFVFIVAAGATGGNGAIVTVLSLVSLAASIWFLIEFGCLHGTIGSNRYGPDPVR